MERVSLSTRQDEPEQSGRINFKQKLVIFFFFLAGGLGSFHISSLDPQKAITQYQLDSWSVDDGLPLHVIYTIQQSGDGFLWLGTRDGLVRFDGIRFKVYNQKNTPWLKSNKVSALYYDHQDNLWIGTGESGLCRLSAGTFTSYPLEKYPALKEITQLTGDRPGNLWIGTFSKGLSRLRDNQLTTYTTKEGMMSNNVAFLLLHSSGVLLVGSPRGVTGMVPLPDNRYRGKALYSIKWVKAAYEKNNGQTWFAADKGLYKQQTSQLTRFEFPPHLSTLKIVSLCEDRDLNFWLGCEGDGLIRWKQNRFQVLTQAPGLSRSMVYSIFEDREASLWLGTVEGGLHRLRDSLFTIYTSREGLSSEKVYCIYQLRNGDILMGTDKGLNRFKDGKFTREFPRLKGADYTIYNLLEDRNGTLWIAGPWGLDRFKNRRFTRFTSKDGLSYNEATNLLEDRQGRIWIGTNNGLNCYDQGKFTRFNTNTGLVDSTVTCLYQDSKENLWIGTASGLSKFSKRRFTNYTTQSGLPHRIIECIYEDNDGIIYIGTRGGMSRLENGSFFNYTTQQGLPTSRVNYIMEDEGRNLWLAGPGGITRVEKKQLQDLAMGKTSLLQPRTYDEQDGLKTRWCGSKGLKDRDGKLWFVTDRGAVMVDPANIKKNTQPPPVVIDQLTMDGQEVNIKGKQVVIPAHIQRVEIRYTATTFIKPRKITFKIKLKGYDDDWVNMENVRLTNYTDLAPGKYTFNVIAANSDGVWNQDGASLDFYKKPHWYQTWWAYISYVFLLLISIFLFVKWRSWKLVREKRRLESIVKERTGEVKEKNIQLQKQSEQLKEMDKVKSRFFANISHEFRTPLTLIMGPLEEKLADSSHDKKQQKEFKMMLRNSRRLLNLVNQLLDLSRFDGGKMELQASARDIVPFFKGIVNAFDSLVLQNGLTLNVHAPDQELILLYDAEKLEHAILNLMINAVKYTPSGGEISVSLKQISGNRVEISVRDTGIGIAPRQLDHIFERFYQAEGPDQPENKGSGIGLALTKEVVKLHNGEITVHSELGKGSEFIISLPGIPADVKPGVPGVRADVKADVKPGVRADVKSSVQMDVEPAVPTGVRDMLDTIAPQEEDDEELSESLDSDAGKNIVLLVEDNADVRSYIRGPLRSLYRVEEAVNGSEGIQKAREIIPDLIISDIMMPGTDGYELCKVLKNDVGTSHIPIILLTAKASEESIVEGFETRADDYVTKPFNTKILIARIDSLIDTRRRLQERYKREIMREPAEIQVSSVDREFMKDLQKAVEANLGDPDFTINRLADLLYMSRATLNRKIRALTGESANRYIQVYRLKRGAQLLKGNFGTVTQVAFEVGFSSSPYFSKCFREIFHQSPQSYQAASHEPGVRADD